MFSEFSKNTFSGNRKNFTTITPVHYVKPHYVKSHLRNGSYIAGYWRDGDGNTNINTHLGYLVRNPLSKTINKVRI